MERYLSNTEKLVIPRFVYKNNRPPHVTDHFQKQISNALNSKGSLKGLLKLTVKKKTTARNLIR